MCPSRHDADSDVTSCFVDNRRSGKLPAPFKLRKSNQCCQTLSGDQAWQYLTEDQCLCPDCDDGGVELLSETADGRPVTILRHSYAVKSLNLYAVGNAMDAGPLLPTDDGHWSHGLPSYWTRGVLRSRCRVNNGQNGCNLYSKNWRVEAVNYTNIKVPQCQRYEQVHF
jgi:hypothetical protein